MSNAQNDLTPNRAEQILLAMHKTMYPENYAFQESDSVEWDAIALTEDFARMINGYLRRAKVDGASFEPAQYEVTTSDRDELHDLGRMSASYYANHRPDWSRDEIEQAAHEDAFSQGIDQYPNIEAAEISEMVDGGIFEYLANEWNK